MSSNDRPDYLALARQGLPPTQKPKKVIVVGAGMAGLSAAYALLRAGHDPLVVEAQERVGGRILTLRSPFTPGLYGEAGAMRIPRAHDLTMAYVEKFNLKLLPFTMNNPQAYCYLNGARYRLADVNANPDCLGFELKENERGKTASQLFDAAIAPMVEQIHAQGDAAWDDLNKRYDKYSTRDFLLELDWSEDAIEMYGVLAHQEARMNASFVELLRSEIGHSFKDMYQVENGLDNLPRAFLPELKGHIRFGAKMIALDQSPDSVSVHYQTHAGRFKATGDYAIITIPFSVLRHIEILKPFSHRKQRAIRELHYDASAKIFLQCRRRFWEEDEGIVGGGTVTDLAIRGCYYPEHGRETGRGVLLASYTWSEDAQRWGSLSPDERIEQAIENVSQIHPQIVEEFEVGASKMWHHDEFAGGAFVLFDPGQQTLLHSAIIAPEGRVHFAGEHASLVHRWIQGAIESGLRAASEVHAAPPPA
jgi:monoamine oxidase